MRLRTPPQAADDFIEVVTTVVNVEVALIRATYS
jgi:hypothetical protein